MFQYLIIIIQLPIQSMSYQSQPKTIEDYKDVVKILKLKIIKQNRRVQELQTKVKEYEQSLSAINIQPLKKSLISPIAKEKLNVPQNVQVDFDTSNLKGKSAVMYLFMQGAKNFGISLESIFRIADYSYKNQVESDYFRSVLSKINLGLTPKQISCLIFIFDQNCSGFINRQDYQHSLHAYQVGLQDSNLPYNQQCLLKLANLLHNDKINLSKFYDQMQSKTKSTGKSNFKGLVDANVFEDQIKKVYGRKIQQREIIGAFNEIDLESQGYLDKTNFMYCVTSFINRLLLGQNIQTKKPIQTGDFTDPPQSNIKNNTNNINDSTITKNDQENTSKKNEALGILQTNYNLKVTEIYQQLTKLSFEQRITLRKFKFAILNLNREIPSILLTNLFKQIDISQKAHQILASAFHRLRYYVIHNLCRFKLIGKYFYYNNLSSQSFLFAQELQTDSDLTKNKFLSIMSREFKTGNGAQWEIVWNTLDKGGRGVINVGAIAKTLGKYQMV